MLRFLLVIFTWLTCLALLGLPQTPTKRGVAPEIRLPPRPHFDIKFC